MLKFLTGLIAGALTMFAAITATLPPQPRLIGHGCLETGGDIWAMEESDFPPCEMIEGNL